MPAQISSILDGPAGPPPAIDKASLRRLSDAIMALPDTRMAALVDLLVANGIPERESMLSLDLEALPIKVFRRVWQCVYDPAPPADPLVAPKRSVVVADVLDADSPKHERLSPKPEPEDDELRDDEDLAPVPSKRKAPSSRAGKQKRRASSVSSRSDASQYRFVQPAPPQPVAGPSNAPAPATGSSPGGSRVQWMNTQRPGIPCTYHSPIPEFPPCTRTFSRVADMRRHIDHQHFEEEAQAVIDGRITRSQATLLGDDWKGQISKPTCEGCGQTFSRKDAVKRHQTETGAKVVDGVCTSCPGSGNGSGAGKKRARRK